MFAKTIIDSDAFLDMPVSARLLYYDLGMRADDDGFVNAPKKIMRGSGASDDDIKILIGKKFIIPFESGIIVIKHWKIHNFIRSDRYHETKYKDEKSTLELDENNSYKQANEQLTTNGIPLVNQMDTEVRLGKVKKDICANKEWFDTFWSMYPKKKSKEDAYKRWNKIHITEELFNTIVAALKKQSTCTDWLKDDGQYIPLASTWLNGKRWEDVIEVDIKKPNTFDKLKKV